MELRPAQREGISCLLQGRDLLAVMPKGSGKSLIFQTAAAHLPGVAVVVTPLIALMRDQVERCRFAAVQLNSALSREENARAVEMATKGRARLIYLAPERLLRADWLQTLRISLFAVDEAHCILDWGFDFRRDYLALADVFEAHGRPPVAAFTATATPWGQSEIARLLRLREPVRLVTGFDRPNLRFRVERLTAAERSFAIAHLLKQTGGPALVYTGTRRRTQELSSLLQASAYHGGMSAAERLSAQRAFQREPAPILVATNAFGMGIHRPDLALVIHDGLPGSLEAYYQEAGRAGRAGQPADAVLFWHPDDVRLHRYFISQAIDGARRREQLQKMLEYAESRSCRRRVLLGYFGEKALRSARCCDRCLAG